MVALSQPRCDHAARHQAAERAMNRVHKSEHGLHHVLLGMFAALWPSRKPPAESRVAYQYQYVWRPGHNTRRVQVRVPLPPMDVPCIAYAPPDASKSPPTAPSAHPPPMSPRQNDDNTLLASVPRQLGPFDDLRGSLLGFHRPFLHNLAYSTENSALPTRRAAGTPLREVWARNGGRLRQERIS